MLTGPKSRIEALVLTLESVRRMGFRQISSRLGSRLRTRLIYPHCAPFLFPTPKPLASKNLELPPFREGALPDSLDREALISSAQAIAAGRFALLGLPEIHLGIPVDWQHSPGPGQRLWQYTLHYGEWARTLAAAHLVDPDAGFLDQLIAKLNDWISHNPVATEPAWEPYPICRRLIAWSRLLAADWEEPQWVGFRQERLEPSLRQQARFLRQNLEYHTPNNHLLANFRALAWVGLLCPHWPESSKWRDIGLQGLWGEMKRQVLADGAHEERSISYHTIVLQDLLETWWLARQRGGAVPDVLVPEEVEPTLVKMLTFLAATMAPDGSWPMVNDSVPGYPTDPRSVLWAASGRVPDWTWEPPDPRHLDPTYRQWFGQARLRGKQNRAEKNQALLNQAQPNQYSQSYEEEDHKAQSPPWKPSPGVASFPGAGYAVLRDADDGFLFFDAGPMGPSTIPGHGHADPLAFVLYGHGQPLLVDPGAETYAAGSRRDLLRSVAAHNTAVIDNEEPCRFWGPFRAAFPYQARLVDHSPHHVTGEHFGYARLSSPVVHRRRIERIEAGQWLIRDTFEGTSEHDLALHFQLAPGAVVTGAGAPGENNSGPLITARWSNGVGLRFRRISQQPVAAETTEGHVATGWNQSQTAPKLTYCWRAITPFESLFLLEVFSG